MLTTLVSFARTNGANPHAALVQGSDGNLYGTTYSGGASNYGTVFRVGTNGALTTLVSFANTNGANPHAGLVQGTDGYFYGTTLSGGASNYGTVFRIGTNGAFATLVSFTSINGARPYAPLVQGSDGYFYGTTYSGGAGGGGTVFRMAQPQPPSITAQPQPQTNAAGSSASFSVSATGTDPLSYQWQRNGTSLSDGADISGSTTNFLTLSSLDASNTGSYQVVVTNLFGSVASTAAVLVVILPPSIAMQPQSTTNAAATTATFTVAATGDGLSYQWRKDAVNLSDNARLSGTATPTLTITGVASSDEGGYSVAISNLAGSTNSAVATLARIRHSSDDFSCRGEFINARAALTVPFFQISGRPQANRSFPQSKAPVFGLF